MKGENNCFKNFELTATHRLQSQFSLRKDKFMKTRLLLAIILIASALLPLASPALPAAAQTTDCIGLTILDESEKTVDEKSICDAAQGLIQRGKSVYVYFTDFEPSSREVWEEYLNHVEQDKLKVYNSATNEIGPSAVVFASTTSQTSWGHTLDRPTSLAINRELAITQRDTFANMIRGSKSDVTGAFKWWILVTTENLFPPTPTPAPTATPAPTPTPSPTLTDRQIDATKQAAAAISATATKEAQVRAERQAELDAQARADADARNAAIGQFLLIAVIIVVAVLLVWFVLIPMYRRWVHRRLLWTQVGLVSRLIRHLLLALDGSEKNPGLLSGESPEKTVSYNLWLSLGGAKQKLNARVIEIISICQAIVRRAMEAKTAIEHAPKPSNDHELVELVRTLETVLFTIIGTLAKTLGMTQKELSDLLDPFVALSPTNFTQLQQQLEQVLRRYEGAGELSFTPMIVKPEQLDEQGVLGLMQELKSLMFDLQQAHSNAQPKLDEARAARAKLAEAMVVPQRMTVEQAFADVDERYAKAQQLIEAEQWMEAQELASETLRSLGLLSRAVDQSNASWQAIQSLSTPAQDAVPSTDEVRQAPMGKYDQACAAITNGQYDDAIALASQVLADCAAVAEVISQLLASLADNTRRQVEIGQAGSAGFDLNLISNQQHQIVSAFDACRQLIISGAYAKATGQIEAATLQSRQALEAVKALIALHEDNHRKSAELSSHVAEHQAFLNGQATPAWKVLKSYPGSNYAAVAEFVELATQTLERIFDNPANAEDLASRIATLNDKKSKSSCDKAAELLRQAFADLAEARHQLEAIVLQLQRVREAESQSSQALELAQADLAKAVELNRRQDEKVDDTVPVKLQQSEAALKLAQKLVAGREFTEAAKAVTESRRLSAEALSSAQQQVSEIDQLFKQLEAVKSSSASAVQQAQHNLETLTSAARSSQAANVVSKAATALRQAKSAESQIAGSQDHQLAAALKQAIQAYESAERLAQQASQQVAQDERAYRQLVSEANSAINSADSAIDSASRYTGDPDAGSAGDSTLSAARSALRGQVSYGASLQEISNARSAAARAQQLAQQAESEARRRIREVEEERERERQRLAEIARREQEARERAEEARRQAQREAEERAERAREASERAERAREDSQRAERARESSQRDRI